jgi:NADPH-dependent 7-cyano-7-deazaguanine reductase QueF
MSQRSKNVNEEIIVELKFKVTINSFSNHNGFKEGQIEQAIQEFKEQIKKELEYKVNGEYQQQEFLQTVDFVSYEADSQNGL